MATSAPQISVIVAVYDQARFLPILLLSLEAQDCPVPYEVIICDDGSNDSTPGIIRSWRASKELDLRYVWQPDTGFRVGRSRNNGARLAQGEILVFVDGDSILRPFCLHEHWEAHREGDKLVYGGCQNVMLDKDATLEDCAVIFDSIPESEPSDLENRIKWVDTDHSWMACTSGNLSINRAQALFFDEQFQGWGSEDRDFAYRGYQNGLTMHLHKRASVVHLQQEDRIVGWNPTKGGDYRSIVAALESKLYLFQKYPGEVMAPSLDLVRYCYLNKTTDTWQLGPMREDVSFVDILAEFETWRERNRSKEINWTGPG